MRWSDANFLSRSVITTHEHMAELYEASRVEKIGRIARRFSTAVRVGDEVEFGLMGDPEFPADYRSNRPGGKVIKVKNAGTDSASIRVRLTTGKSVDVMPHTVDPRRCWEFTDEHFPKVLARTQANSSGGSSAAPKYGRGATVPRDSYEALLAKVDALSSRLDEEMRESRNFNGAMVASFNEMAGEVSKVNPEAPFCKTFNSEYRGMMDKKPKAQHMASPFDSDFESDSDADY